MANDPALPLSQIAQATASFYALVSNPEALPEFRNLQVTRLSHEPSRQPHLVIMRAFQYDNRGECPCREGKERTVGEIGD
jgi:hypothetical protein